MLKHKLRLLIIAAVGFLLIFLGLEYKSVPVADRAFVLGLGIDYNSGVYELTAEILVPAKSAGGGSMNEESHKIISGHGADTSQALNDIFQKTGKLPSLGHCAVLILGETVYKRDILNELDFFVRSEAFRGNTPVAVTDGSAKDLMNTKTPLENFTSISIYQITSVYGKNTNTAMTTLQDFRVKTLSPSASSYLTVIKAIPVDGSQASGGDGGEAGAPDEPLVFYDCSSVAAFKNGQFVSALTTEETEGMKLLQNKNNFDSFLVPSEGGGTMRVLLASKNVAVNVSLGDTPSVVYELTVKLKPAEAEEINTAEGFISNAEITDAMREDAKSQMTEKINAALRKAADTDTDFLHLGNKFFARYGKSWEQYISQNPDYPVKINFSVKITVS